MGCQQRQREAKRAFWRNALADWARSGMSKSDYARLHGLKVSTLRWWSSRYPEWARRGSSAQPADAGEAPESAAGSAPAAAPTFLTITPQDGQGDARAEPLRLTIGGTTVEVPPGFCEQTLERLLGVLERRG